MAIKGDFISFTYNGVHSTELGVMRVTSSNRYTDALLPTIQDKTVQVPGGNGTYFFGSYYTQRPITINVAFDEVTEDQIRLMRKIFGDQLSHELVFDDEPYKVYYAKSTGTPQLQYVPFSSPRVYKGEGTFTFTCYEPFAHCLNQYKYLDKYTAWSYKSNSFRQGYYNSNNNGEYTNSQNIICFKDSLIFWGSPEKEYVIKTNLPYYNIAFYNYKSSDGSMVWKENSGWRSSNQTFTTPALAEGYNGLKMRVMLAKTNSFTSNVPETFVNDLGFFVLHAITQSPYYWYNNKDEWNLSAGLLEEKGTYDTFNASGFTNGFKLYNPGDVETDFKLIVDFKANLTGIKVATAFDSEALDSTLNIKVDNVKNTSDKFLLFDSKTNIIYGLKSKNVNAKTGSVYNDWIKSGQWFKIPKNSNTQYGFYLINYEAKPGVTPAAPILQYDYLYF